MKKSLFIILVLLLSSISCATTPGNITEEPKFTRSTEIHITKNKTLRFSTNGFPKVTDPSKSRSVYFCGYESGENIAICFRGPPIKIKENEIEKQLEQEKYNYLNQYYDTKNQEWLRHKDEATILEKSFTAQLFTGQKVTLKALRQKAYKKAWYIFDLIPFVIDLGNGEYLIGSANRPGRAASGETNLENTIYRVTSCFRHIAIE